MRGSSRTLLTVKISQDSEGRGGRLNEERLLNQNPQVQVLPPAFACCMALGNSLGKSDETLGWNPVALGQSFNLSVPQCPHLQNKASKCT